MSMHTAPGYKYTRPPLGQPEERYWANLPPNRREYLALEIRSAWNARRDAWNATHTPDRHLPRQTP